MKAVKLPAFSVAPSVVSNITVDNNSTSLWLSWKRPEGDVDALVVTLSCNGSIIQETTLPRDATDISAHQLTPGSEYQVVMMSVSNGLTNQSEITVKTGESGTDLFFVFFF